MLLKNYHYPYVLVGFLFLSLVAMPLFSDGMFLDGLLYADIARNMSVGLGSFWMPHLTDGLYPEFYEHPPLAMGLQGLFFKIFGDSIYVERLYSLSTAVIIGVLMVQIWKKLTHEVTMGWLPLLFVTLTDVPWAIANNMLENTMTIFVCLSFLYYLKFLEKRRLLWMVLSGIALAMGFLSKGFVCFYLWTMPCCFWIFNFKNRRFIRVVTETTTLVLSTMVPLVFLYFMSDEAATNMTQYFYKQVLGSIENVATVNSRFYIIGAFLQNSVGIFIVGMGVTIWAFKKGDSKQAYQTNLKTALGMVAIVFAGILPIMISMKQRSFYINTVYPLFAIAVAYYLYPIIKNSLTDKHLTIKEKRWLQSITIVMVILGISLSLSQINHVGRDKERIDDVKTVIEYVGKNKGIYICPKMYSEWSLHGYFSRYGNVSLYRSNEKQAAYYLTLKDGCQQEILGKSLQIVDLKLKKYRFYKVGE